MRSWIARVRTNTSLSAMPRVPPTSVRDRAPLRCVDLTIIEPRLSSAAGHFHSLASALIAELPPGSVRVACSPGGQAHLPSCCDAWPNLNPKLSKVGLALAMRRLAGSTSSMCVLTACDRSLVVAAAVLPKSCALTGIVHDVGWVRRNYLLRMAARLRPDLRIACFGTPVHHAVCNSGLRTVQQFEYPIDPVWRPDLVQSDSPTHLLMAGGPRSEKGFLELARWCLESQRGRPLPVRIHGAKPDADCSAAVRELVSCGASDILVRSQPLTPGEFRQDFLGAIVLLLHRPAEYHGRASGLFLDAIMAGSPMIAVAGSRFARDIEQHDLGVIVESTDPLALRRATEQAKESWRRQIRALQEHRAKILALHSARPLASFVANT